ncbi:GPI-N-acetylgalactosamine transferase PGAP4 [Microcaecilia unicolor]|uniref:Transmembrane protein 246 n=1 Tax=Microcaecilia unicolor TaxID=1415580 RepID=A0A6P7ZTT2_9AMPH|nr:transmembrane protein 246 [Microcaecilia unicolor]
MRFERQRGEGPIMRTLWHHFLLWVRPRGGYCTSTFLQFFTLTAVTFGIVLPLVCHDLLHSYYFIRSWHLDHMSWEFLEQNLEEAQAAVQYFDNLRLLNSSLLTSANADESSPKLVITIVTVQRQLEYHYPLQVMSRFHHLLARCGKACRHHHLFLCNVDQNPQNHQDAHLLAKFFPTAVRYGEKESVSSDDGSINLFEKEKQDYAYCLAKTLSTFNTEYVMVVEDDAVPEDDIFSVLHHLLLARFLEPPLGGALYFKLYHPERLQRYVNPEPMRILEWIGLGMFLGTFLSLIYAWVLGHPDISWPIFLFFMLYSMALTELFGRHYLLELRRLTPALYNVVPVTECCTPAMLYSAASARRTLGYFNELYCRPGFAKDTALYSILRKKGEWAYVVEPNLVRHVGLHSSLRGLNSDPKLL